MDGELYLRLLLEECLADQSRTGFEASAIALVAVGAIPPETAYDLTTDYELACQLRGDDFHHPSSGLHFLARLRGHRWETLPEPAGLEAAAIAVGPVSIQTADGPLTVSWITTGPEGRVHGSVALDPDDSAGATTASTNLPRSRRRRPTVSAGYRPPPWLNLQIVDDRGQTYRSSGGGGGSSSFDILLSPSPPSDISWFEIVGPGDERTRLAVRAADPPPPAHVTPQPRSRAQLYLFHSLISAVFGTIHRGWDLAPELGDIAKALIGAGELAETDPLVGQARQVSRGNLEDVTLDSRLRSALRAPALRASADKPEQLWPIGTVVSGPGFALRVDALSDSADGTSVFGVLQPGAYGGYVPYVLMARDDLGQHYLAGIAGGHGSESGMSIQWQLHPPLHPTAAVLDVVVIGLEAQTEIPVSLK